MASKQQIQNKKIQRIVTFKTNITNTIDYHTFFKKGLASSRTLNVEYLAPNFYHNNEGRDQMQKRLIKLLKKAKPTKALHLHKCIVQYDNIPDPIIIQIAKRISRVKALSLPDYALSQELINKYALWLKYAKGVRRFDYIAPPCSEYPEGQIKKFERSLKKFFHEIRRDRISSLNISHRTADESLAKSFMMFKQYPSTLKSLAFDWRHYSAEADLSLPNIKKPLSHMRDLTSVSLSFRNQVNLIDPIISSIHDPSQIKNLKIELLNNGSQELELPLGKLGNLTNLSNLSLSIGYWPKGFESFLTRLKTYPLKKLYLDATIDEDRQLQDLKNLISHLRGLESLTLKVYKSSPIDSEPLVKDLFEKISQIRPLKNLKLHLKVSSVSKSRQNVLFSNCTSSLKGLFSKTIKLEKFSFRFNQVDAQKVFPELIALVTRGAPALQKLEINVGEFKAQEEDYSKVMALIKRLHSVEVLKLNSLSGSLSRPMQDLVEEVNSLKFLKTFELREIKGTSHASSLAGIVERILSKRGLTKFDCSLSWESRELARRSRGGFQIDLMKVMQKNPSLKSYPRSPGMYVYYDDDTDWKWL